MKLRSICVCAAALILGSAGVLISGCSIVDTVRGQLSEFHEAAMADGEEAVVYDTAQRSLEAMGYVRERGTPASHRLEMTTPIQPGGNAQNLRQRRAVLEFRAMGSEGTEIKIGFWEASEEASQKDNAVTGSRLIRGGTLYEAFWERLEKALPDSSLSEPSTPAPAPGATAAAQ